MKKRKLISIIVSCLCIFALMFLLFSGCSSKSTSTTAPSMGTDSYYDNSMSESMDSIGSILGNSSSSSNKAPSSNGSAGNSAGNSTGSTSVNNNENISEDITVNVPTERKIIETYDYDVETKTYDSFISSLSKKIKDVGGYIETSSSDDRGNLRYSEMKIRVPKDEGEGVTTFLSENSNVVSSSSSAVDITLTYTDIQSKIEAYKTEKAQLEKLMSNATNLTDILAIQDRLTNVIYEIETREAQLRAYDDKADYTTISLSVWEVEKETVTHELTVWEEIKENLTRNLKNIGDFFVSFFVSFVSSLPYLVIIAIIAVVVIFVIKHKKKKCKKTKDEK